MSESAQDNNKKHNTKTIQHQQGYTFDHYRNLLSTAMRNFLLEHVIDLGEAGEITFEHPQAMEHGDVATNIALAAAGQHGQNPRAFAENLVQYLEQQELLFIQKIEVAGPGFINFFFDQRFFQEEVAQILEYEDAYGSNTDFAQQKILVEHSSPNLFKAFHIGHLMNNTVGESLVRLYTYGQGEVVTMSYPSDVSLGIGKAVWQLMQYGFEKLTELSDPEAQMDFLGRCYAEGVKAYNEQEGIHQEVRTITQDMYEQNDTEAYRIYSYCKDLNLSYFLAVTARLGSHFDTLIFESEAGVVGKEIILEHTPAIYTQSNGATIYEGEQDGLHTRVFINKEGNPTYEAKDTGLMKLKFDRYQPDLSVFVTDHEQGQYFQVVAQAAGRINTLWKDRTIHVTHGRMKFQGQKMSSRLGNTPRVVEILNVLNKEVAERAQHKELSETAIDEISLAALRYTILRAQTGKNVNFDPETSLSFEGDSGPYLQYTYARINSLLVRAAEAGITPNAHPSTRPQNTPDPDPDPNPNLNPDLSSDTNPDFKSDTTTDSMSHETSDPTELERYLYRFPDIVRRAQNHHEPHHIVTYLTELARMYNRWYAAHRIIDDANHQASYQLALSKATAHLLKNGMWLLGIVAQEQM